LHAEKLKFRETGTTSPIQFKTKLAETIFRLGGPVHPKAEQPPWCYKCGKEDDEVLDKEDEVKDNEEENINWTSCYCCNRWYHVTCLRIKKDKRLLCELC